MKITTFLLFLTAFCSYAENSLSQNARVNINKSNVTLDEILNEIESQTDYLFIYNNDINANNQISVKAKTKPVREVLNDIFKETGISYTIEGTHIILYQKKTEKNGSITDGRIVKGTVTDINGEPIIGVSILVKNTTTGTVSDFEGRFQLTVPSNETILILAYLGYLTQEVPVGNQKELIIRLQEDTKVLNEIVVVGYGSQRKGEVASAISSIKSDGFIKGLPTPDAAQLIKGQVAGLSIITPDANPTSVSQISLRGTTTLMASAAPLVLIDGIPGELNSVSPEDIQQIDVLKDGSAAAIYGTRGTNGVILITTKNVKGEMPTTIEINAYLSTQQITKKLPFLNASQYRELVAQGKPGAYDDGSTTNWLDEVLQTPITQTYNISLRGGSRNTNYVASFEYRGINGIMKRSDNQMMFPRIEIYHRMFNDKLRMTASLSGYTQSYFSGADGGSYNNGVYRNALIYNPTTPIKDANGNWSENPSATAYSNPLALLYETEGKNEATNLRAFATATFSPIKGLDIKYLASTNIYNQVRGYYETHNHLSTVSTSKNGYASRGTTRKAEDISELTIQYNKTLNSGHSFSTLGGYSWLKDNYQNYWMQNNDFPSDDYTYNNMGLGQALVNGKAGEGSYQQENKLIGYFGRINYNYEGKYMLSASIRYEGSSKFGANHKWGTFPAISVAWNIKEEKFLKNNTTLSALKVRAGFGITGTEPTNPYMSLNRLSLSDYVGYGKDWVRVIKQQSNPNPDLRWEKKEETNVGLDFGFWNDRIYGSIDLYNRTTKDLLWNYSVPTPPYLYKDIVANAGSIRNRGLELSLTWIPVKNADWQWITSANYSTNQSKLISLSNDKFISNGYADAGGTGEPMQQTTHRIEEGKPIGNFYGFKSIDIDDKGYWIIEGKDGNPKSINGQQPTDKHILGNGLPQHYLNWNNTVSYKKLDLSIAMRGAFRFQILNMASLQYGVPVMLGRGNILVSAYDKVYGKRPLADDQSLQYVSYYIENGDYWKIDHVTLGYTFDFNNQYIQKARIFGTVSNLATITGYSGIDPEVGISGLAPGIDDKNRYPSARTFTFGLSLKF